MSLTPLLDALSADPVVRKVVETRPPAVTPRWSTSP